MIIIRSNNLPAVFGTLKVFVNDTEVATFDKEALGKEIAFPKEQTYKLIFKQSIFTTQIDAKGEDIIVISAPPFFTTFYTLSILFVLIPFFLQKHFLIVLLYYFQAIFFITLQ